MSFGRYFYFFKKITMYIYGYKAMMAREGLFKNLCSHFRNFKKICKNSTRTLLNTTAPESVF